jgi:pimeloyl-ACP methyl ester carboxylesterase
MPIDHVLLLHGNGGAASRFRLFQQAAAQRNWPVRLVVPELPGFEGRPVAAPTWDAFLEALGRTVAPYAADRWAVYGHGIGGSLLLEWAAQGWRLPNGGTFTPERVLLHAPVGASLAHRFFPQLMRPRPLRDFIHWLIYQPALRPLWERKLFLYPERIPAELRRQFFTDYRHCAAFPVFFDLITPAWYASVLARLEHRDFHFIWGERERVIASEFVAYWRRDFPGGTFTIVPAWDHFPMLEQTADFTDRMAQWLNLAS